MRAALHDRYGPPEVVRVGDAPDPVPGPDEVLVRVRATTVNRTDCGYRSGSPPVIRAFSGLRRPRARIWGTEYTGTVERVGSGVRAFEPGQPVLGYAEGRFGAHAELMAVPAGGRIVPVPDGISVEQAAASTEGSHYALSILRRTGLEEGRLHRVLVHGATGAIGSATVQLLVARGVEVTAVCDDPALVDLVGSLGPGRVVDRSREDFTADDTAYDLVLDAVGKSSFAECRSLLTPRGNYVSSELGRFVQNPVLALVTPLGRRRRVRFPLPDESVQIIRDIAAHLADGTFRPVIDRHYPLAEIVEAYRYVESGRKVGNVVIDVDLDGG